MERELKYVLSVVANDDNATVLRTWVDARKAADKQVLDSATRREAELAKAWQKSADENERVLTRVFQTRLQQLDKVNREERRARTDREREETRSATTVQTAWQRTHAATTAARNQMIEGLTGTVEATAKVARGFALLGVSGDKNLGRMAENLTKIQGTFDALVGGAKIFQNLTKAADGYRKLVGEADQATGGLANTLLSAGAEVAFEGIFNRVGKAFGRGGKAASVGGTGAGSLGRGAAAGSIDAMLGAPVAAAAGNSGGMAGAAAAAGPYVAAAAAAAIGLLAAEMHFNPTTPAGTPGASPTAGISEMIAGWGALISGRNSGYMGGDYSLLNRTDDALTRAEGERTAVQADRARREAIGRGQGVIDDAAFARDQARGAFGRAAGAEQLGGRVGRNQGDLAAVRAALADAAGQMITADTPEQRDAARRRQEELEGRRGGLEAERETLLAERRRRMAEEESGIGSRLADTSARLKNAAPWDRDRLTDRKANLEREAEDAARRRFEMERSILDERRNVTREGVAAAERELDITRQRVAADKERLQGAAERFGQMSPFEQQRAIRAKQKADRGEELSRDERNALRGVGTEDASKIVRAGDAADAERAGFSKYFGDPERKRIASGEESEKTLAVKIEGGRTLEVSINAEEDAMIDRFKEEIVDLFNKREATLDAKIQRAAREVEARIRNQTDRRLVAASATG